MSKSSSDEVSLCASLLLLKLSDNWLCSIKCANIVADFYVFLFISIFQQGLLSMITQLPCLKTAVIAGVSGGVGATLVHFFFSSMGHFVTGIGF